MTNASRARGLVTERGNATTHGDRHQAPARQGSLPKQGSQETVADAGLLTEADQQLIQVEVSPGAFLDTHLAGVIQRLQAAAGNAAVARLLTDRRPSAPIQRVEGDEGQTLLSRDPIQRIQREEEEERLLLSRGPVQLIQREEEEERLLLSQDPVQRQGVPEEEEIQSSRGPVQRQGVPEEEEIQTSSGRHAQAAERAGRHGSSAAVPDLSGVRVHTDGEADSLARSYDALALATGGDIYFRSGAYDPGTTAGRALLGHELAHVAQQAEGRTAGLHGVGGDAALRAVLEAEADQFGVAVADGVAARPAISPGGEVGLALQRQEGQAESGDPAARARRQFNEGSAAYRSGDYARALEIFQLLAQTAPNAEQIQKEMLWNMGMCYLRLGNVPAAKVMFENFLARTDISEADRAQAQARLQEVGGGEASATEGAAPDAQTLFNQGATAYRQGKFDVALDLFQRLSAMPGQPQQVYTYMWWNMARCMDKMGRNPEAVDLLNRFLTQPDITSAERGEAEALLARLAGTAGGGQVDQVESTPAPTPSAAPPQELPADPQQRARALFDRGRDVYSRGGYAEALALFTQMMEITGLATDVYSATLWNIATCHERLGEKEPAIEMYQRFLAQPNISAEDRTRAQNKINQLQGG